MTQQAFYSESAMIVLSGHKALRGKAKPVSPEDMGSEDVHTIIKKMSEALRKTTNGIGLAAPQIGVPLRIFIASGEALAIEKMPKHQDESDDREKKKKTWKHYVFINPEVVKISSKKIKSVEGCLSIPKKYGLVSRAQKIRVRAFDENGKKFERGASNLFARLLQHELDHLNGILYIDKAEKMIDAQE